MHSIKNTTIALFLPLILAFSAFGQVNLVPNASFEDTVSCPNLPDQVNYCVNWSNPTTATPDYYNSCNSLGSVDVPNSYMGYQMANTGEAYMGIVLFAKDISNYREYIKVQLQNPLASGVEYFVSFNITLADSSIQATDGIGMYISNTDVSSNADTVLSFVPQVDNPSGNILVDKVNWTKIKGSFVASGGEEFALIGNFRNDGNSDSLFVGGADTTNLNYRLSYYWIDDICISNDSTLCYSSVGLSEIDGSTIKVFPNPVNDIINIKSNNQILELSIFSSINQAEVMKREVNAYSTSLSISELPDGMYFMRIFTTQGVITKKIIHYK